MNIAEVKYNDIANGPGVRTSVFVSGCRNMCPDCFNQKTWDFKYGDPLNEELRDKIINSLDSDFISGLTVLGGEPFEPENQEELIKLISEVREKYPTKTVWCFSGFTYEELTSGTSRASTEYTSTLLNLIDILVDGRFEKEKKNISLQFRGSENQRIIDIKKTKENGTVTIWSEIRR